MQLSGIHHIALNVRDLDQAERFYTDVLGFPVTHRFHKGLRHLMMDTGNAMIALFEDADLDTAPAWKVLGEDGYMHLAFGAPKDQFETIVEELKTKNITINGPVQRGQGKSIYFNDPDGNPLEIHYDEE